MKDSQLTALVTPILEEFGLELEEIVVLPAGKRRLVRVVVDGDGPQGRGPLLDDIAEATKGISAALDSQDVAGAGPYTLEVSSRGIGRPLTAPRHWRRNTDRLVRAQLGDGSVLTGRVGASDERGVDLDVDGALRRITYDDVSKATVQVEFNRSGAAPEESEQEV